MDEMNIREMRHGHNPGSDDRLVIHQAAHGREPEKDLQTIIDREGSKSPAGQYAQMLLDVMPETIKKVHPADARQILPMLITARNEELSLPQTVKTLMESACEFLKTHPDFHVAIVIANNASTDETTAAVARVYAEHKAMLLKNHISIEVIYEGKPGKINGIRKGVKHIEERFGHQYTHIISGDADVRWDQGAVNALWKTAHPETGVKPLLVGSNVIPLNRKNFWGFLEHVIYYGYGSLPPRQQGLFMKIVNGMGYLADKSTLHHWEDIPVEIGSDDTALSALVGPENIAIAGDAIVRYELTEDWDNFVKIRGRHVRETYRIERWLSDKYGEEQGVGMVSAIVVTKALTMLDGFFRPTAPLEKLDGSLYQNAKKIIRHIQSVPFLNYPFLDIFVVLFYMPVFYIYLTYKGIRQLYHVSWWVALIGLWRKLYCSSYVTYLQKRDLKQEKQEQAIVNRKGILWNPALQRKNLESMQQKKPVFEFLSNNLNWAYATILMIGTLILWFIIKNFFQAVSKAFSALSLTMPATPESIDIHATHSLTGNNMKTFLEMSSQVFYVISQNVLMTFLVLGVMIFFCLLAFHAVQSSKREKRFGGKFIAVLSRTCQHFLDVAAFPFVVLEKAILYPVATVSVIARRIFTKRS